MLKVNVENAIKLDAIERNKKVINKISSSMKKLEAPGFNNLGWMRLPNTIDDIQIDRMIEEAKFLEKENVDTLIVIGHHESTILAKGIIKNLAASSSMKTIFVGDSMSSMEISRILEKISDKNFAINAISKNGDEIEMLVAFRLFKKLLEEKVGINNAKKFIYITTNSHYGPLHNVGSYEELKKFTLPDNIPAIYAGLTPLTLFPLACSNVNIKKIIKGAKEQLSIMEDQSEKGNLENAYLYAVTRLILSKRYDLEALVSYEPGITTIMEWVKQLFTSSEAKSKKGIVPLVVEYPKDLRGIGQIIQDSSINAYETNLLLETPRMDISIHDTDDNKDDLNRYIEKSVDEMQKGISNVIMENHLRVNKIPQITITIDKLNEFTVGEMILFFQYAAAMSAYLFGVNPFAYPNNDLYKHGFDKELSK